MKMRVLILSCNTGGGHNAAGKAIKEKVEQQGGEAVFLDYLRLAGDKVSDVVGGGYVAIAKNTPRFFGGIYGLGMFVSRHLSPHKSPVYYVNKAMTKHLAKYIAENHFDAIVMPHLYPAETITHMKRLGIRLPFTAAIATDYTCIPFWEETDCDAYILPAEDLIHEFAQRGMQKNKLIPLGIPVSVQFEKSISKFESREQLKIDKNIKMQLIMGGSMGAGNLVKLVKEAVSLLEQEEEIYIICGSNKKIENHLREKYRRHRQVRVIGYTDKVYLYLKACDVVFTKPGGLTSTEAAVCGTPMVHIHPIPGCETANCRYFYRHQLSLTAPDTRGQALIGKRLLYDKDLRSQMMRAQNQCIQKNASEAICAYIQERCDKK